MRTELMDSLACPSDGHYPLDLTAQSMGDDGRVETGHLECSKCRLQYPIKTGVPCFALDLNTQDELEALKAVELRARDNEAIAYDDAISDARARAEASGLARRLQLTGAERLVDLGCGTGRLTSLLSRRASSTVGLDFSLESLKVFRRRIDRERLRGVDLVQADIYRLPFREQVFDRVVSNGVFEHLPTLSQDSTPIKQVARILSQNGRFVLSIFGYSGIRAWIAKRFPSITLGEGFEREGYFSNGIYYRRFEWAEVRDLLQGIFTIEHIDGMRIVPRQLIDRGGFIALGLESALQRLPGSRHLGYFVLATARRDA